MDFLISIFLPILISYLVYKAFQKSGLISGFLVILVLNLIGEVLESGLSGLFKISLSLLISSFIQTAINLFIYKKTTTFTSFFILSIIINLMIGFVLGLIFTIIAMSFFSSIF